LFVLGADFTILQYLCPFWEVLFSMTNGANFMWKWCLKRSSWLSGFGLIVVFTLLTACQTTRKPSVSVEEQVQDSYERYVLLLDAGVTSMMELKLVDGQVEGEISRPTDADLEAFYLLYTENPLCTDSSDEKAVVACLVEILKEKGCVRLATCADCIYSCD
jgi:hypothetical protein